MENQGVIDEVRGLFVKVLSFDRMGLVEKLNMNGFPISPNADEETLITTSLNAMQLSDKFREELAQLMVKFADSGKDYKSFAPYQNDMTESLAPQDLKFEHKMPDSIFQEAPLFAK